MILRLTLRHLAIALLAGAVMGSTVLRTAPAVAQVTISALDDSLARLSEILGALHYLRGICNSGEGNRWRNEMQALVDAEGNTPERKTRMVAAFNRGFQGYQQSYRTCTAAAGAATRRYLEEGAKLSREVTARYSN
jgi:uncharacterized protein (TIGR02301 family)